MLLNNYLNSNITVNLIEIEIGHTDTFFNISSRVYRLDVCSINTQVLKTSVFNIYDLGL